MIMIETIPMRQPNARGARLTVIGQRDLVNLQAMIEAHWRHNVGTASQEDIKHWQSMIDEIDKLLI